MTGLYSARNRDLSPTLGRPVQADPLGLAPDVNCYRWEENRPTDLADPSGLEPPPQPYDYDNPPFLQWANRVQELPPSAFLGTNLYLGALEVANPSALPAGIIAPMQDVARDIGAVADNPLVLKDKNFQRQFHTDFFLAGMMFAGCESAMAGSPSREANAVERIMAPGGAAGSGGSRLVTVGQGANAPRLVHLTSNAGKAGIEASGQIIGRHGIFAVPEAVANESTVLKVLRTGVSPSGTAHAIPVPDAATELFRRPIPIGPYSAWKYFGANYYAPPGAVNTATGHSQRALRSSAQGY